VTPGRHPPERGRSAALSGLVLFEAGKLIPIPVYEVGERGGGGVERPREAHRPGKQSDARESVGRSLRRAFPLPDSGSFASLLGRLEEA
jgi:hypothetical protein